MKKHKLNCIIPFVIYPFEVMVSFAQNDEELRKSLRSKGIKGEEELWIISETTIGRACQFSSGSLLIRMKNFPDSSFDYGCLSHEIFHVVTMLMKKIGMPFKLGTSDEAYAYLIGYITEQIFINIRKTLIKK